VFSKQTVKASVNKPQGPAGEQGLNKKKELDDLAAETLRRVIDSIDDTIDLEKLDAFQKRQFTEQIYDTLVSLLEERNRHLSQGDKQKVIQYVLDEILGYGPINSLLNDPSVTEIMVNGYDNVYVEKNGIIIKTDITFRDNDHVLHAINKIITPLGRRIDESSPTVDARLPDGSRVNAIIPPLALKGPSLTIRKFSADPFTVEDLIQFGTMTREMAMFLKACVRARINMIVTGGTGSGKTTTLNVLSSFIPENERIVTIEDTAELQLCQDHVVTLESRPANIEGRGEFTIRELVINSLRMRPDRIVIGEVRGGEALDMLQAMNTGHDGSISTLHANNPRDALSRLETMVLMAGMELPLKAIREQISSAIELIIHQTRFSDGSRKITRISEVVGIENDSIVLQDIFAFRQEGVNEQGHVQGYHIITGIVPRCLEKLKAHGELTNVAEMIPEWEAKTPAAAAQAAEEAEKEETVHENQAALREQEPVAAEEAVTVASVFIKEGVQHCSDGNVALQLQENGSDDSREENASQNPGAAGRNFNNVISLHEKLTVSERPASQSKKQEATLEAPENSLEIETREEQQGEYGEPETETYPSPGVNSYASEPETSGRETAEEEIPWQEDLEKDVLQQHAGAQVAGDSREPVPGGKTEQSRSSGRLSRLIPENMRGIALPVNETSGLMGYLAPGDRVDVLVVHEKSAGGELFTRVAAQNAVVLAAGEKPDKVAGKMSETSHVLLAVTPEQAATLVSDTLKGRFHLLLCPGP